MFFVCCVFLLFFVFSPLCVFFVVCLFFPRLRSKAEQSYWHLRNSWGEYWGEMGNARQGRRQTQLGGTFQLGGYASKSGRKPPNDGFFSASTSKNVQKGYRALKFLNTATTSFWFSLRDWGREGRLFKSHTVTLKLPKRGGSIGIIKR